MNKTYQPKKFIAAGHIGYHKVFYNQGQNSLEVKPLLNKVPTVPVKSGLERFINKYPNWPHLKNVERGLKK